MVGENELTIQKINNWGKEETNLVKELSIAHKETETNEKFQTELVNPFENQFLTSLTNSQNTASHESDGDVLKKEASVDEHEKQIGDILRYSKCFAKVNDMERHMKMRQNKTLEPVNEENVVQCPECK